MQISPEGTTTVTDSRLDWSDLDRRAVDTIRVLAMDAVEQAGNGHPGTAMSLAPAAAAAQQQQQDGEWHDPPDRRPYRKHGGPRPSKSIIDHTADTGYPDVPTGRADDEGVNSATVAGRPRTVRR